MSADSIFTKIIKGEIPCHKIYEDELTLAFLDIHPIQPGHTLVVSKKQIEFVWDLPDEDYRAVMGASKKIAGRLRDVLKADYIGLKVIGIDVPHAHVHVFPFSTIKDYGRAADMSAESDHSALAEMARKLSF